MTTLGPSPFVWLQFDEQGKLKDNDGTDARADLAAALATPGVTDLVVLSHGWQNDLPDALKLYTTLWGNSCAALAGRGRDPAKIVVAGVLWPSKIFDADYDGAQAMVAQQDAAGALAVRDVDALPGDVGDAAFAAGLDIFADFVGGPEAATAIAAAKAASGSYQEGAAYDFFQKAKTALGFDSPTGHADSELSQDAALFAKADTSAGADDLLTQFSVPFTLDVEPGTGAAQGLGTAVSSVFQGARSAVLWALNKLTYYTMKNRAGVVGVALADTVLSTLAPATDLRLHLIGHSFGGRLVTAAVSRLVVPGKVTLASVTLLEAAYSHNGLTAGKGPFAAVVGKPKGPLSITHTHNDLACTVAYPLASRVSGDVAQALGDASDPYGAMGANGPQGLAAGTVVICDSQTFALQSGVINTILADGFIVKTATSDAHNNVTNPTCGKLVAAAISALL